MFLRYFYWGIGFESFIVIVWIIFTSRRTKEKMGFNYWSFLFLVIILTTVAIVVSLWDIYYHLTINSIFPFKRIFLEIIMAFGGIGVFLWEYNKISFKD